MAKRKAKQSRQSEKRGSAGKRNPQNKPKQSGVKGSAPAPAAQRKGNTASSRKTSCAKPKGQAAAPAPGATARGQSSKLTHAANAQNKPEGQEQQEFESDVKKIFKTTDGKFTGRNDITKPRNVAVIEQREDDGALAVVKIYSKKKKKGKSYIKRLVLKPKKHIALTEKSIVGARVIIGVEVKTKNGKEYKPIFKGDLTPTGDALTERELEKVKRGAGGRSKKNKETLKNKLTNWRNHFEK